MAYDIRDSASIEYLREYVQGVSAGLDARDATKSLVPTWLALDGKLKAARDVRDDARFERVRTIRRYGVVKTDFLNALTTLSGTAFLASGKDASAVPYSLLFGRRRAEDVRELGFNNLRDFADTFFVSAQDVRTPQLAPIIAATQAAFALVFTAGGARQAARVALVSHENRRAELVIEVEDLADDTEAKVLTAFPGRRELVRTLLSPSLDTGSGDKKDNDESQPTTPPAET